MRRAVLVLLVCFATACGTRTATYSYIGLAGVSGALAIHTKVTACDGDHSECDRVGPAVMTAFWTTAAIGFGIAALISWAATPSPTQR